LNALQSWKRVNGLFYRFTDTTVFGYGTADIFGIPIGRCETETNFDGFHDPRPEIRWENQKVASLITNQYLYCQICSGPDAIPRDGMGQDLSKLLYHACDSQGEPPFYSPAIADPPPSMALDWTGQIHPTEDVISLQAGLAPSFRNFVPFVQPTVAEDTQVSGYSVVHLNSSFEASPQLAFVNPSVLYPRSPMLKIVSCFNSHTLHVMPPDMLNGAVITIRPDDAIGSNTPAPSELAVIHKLTPNHFIAPAQQAARLEFASGDVSSNHNLPPGAFHTKAPLQHLSLFG